ncbi:spore coat protein GerQ [Thalassobacillus devorans]|uniref:spore coat protein GerQ n=1 Tax=Thalassobacillus devorans TaxID=279813 RepID=UPI003F88254E
MSQNNKENKTSSNTQQNQPYYAANPYLYYYPSSPAQTGYYKAARSDGGQQGMGMMDMAGAGQQGMMPGMMWAGQQGMMPGMMGGTGNQGGMAPPGTPGGMLQTEESYIENILRLNRGKEATVYMTFENNDQWNAKIFKGIIEAAGRDHIILSDPQSGKRYLLLMVYLDYITFDEEIEYSYPFNNTGR